MPLSPILLTWRSRSCSDTLKASALDSDSAPTYDMPQPLIFNVLMVVFLWRAVPTQAIPLSPMMHPLISSSITPCKTQPSWEGLVCLESSSISIHIEWSSIPQCDKTILNSLVLLRANAKKYPKATQSNGAMVTLKRSIFFLKFTTIRW